MSNRKAWRELRYMSILPAGRLSAGKTANRAAIDSTAAAS